MDQDLRVKLYRQADRILMEEMVVVPTEYGSHEVLMKPWIARLPLGVAGRSEFWKDVVIEPH